MTGAVPALAFSLLAAAPLESQTGGMLELRVPPFDEVAKDVEPQVVREGLRADLTVVRAEDPPID